MASAPIWWGEYDLPMGETRRWCIGSTTLLVQRRAKEWRLGWACDEDHLSMRLDIDEPESESEPFSMKQVARVVEPDEGARLALRPALADRPVIIRPEHPLKLMGGDRVWLYVSIPVWIVVATATRTLVEIPGFRLSDTWFGTSTREGELCYASKVFGRLTEGEVLGRPHRAQTALDLYNEGSKPLLIERIKLPVALLGLWTNQSGRLWTDDVLLSKGEAAGTTVVRVVARDEGGRVRHPERTRITEPREVVSEGRIARVFSNLFA